MLVEMRGPSKVITAKQY